MWVSACEVCTTQLFISQWSYNQAVNGCKTESAQGQSVSPWVRISHGNGDTLSL
jgi:hypothetical protein